jgi:hypothetical protein
MRINAFYFALTRSRCFPFLREHWKSGRAVKMVLHENTGRFSLYYLTDLKKERYEALSWIRSSTPLHSPPCR